MNKEIIEELKFRRINRVLHFTRMENINSILEGGIVPISKMSDKERQVRRNDPDRFDGLPDCSCFSFAYPNRQLMRKFSNDFTDGVWVVIEVSADVFIDHNAYFYPSNASSKIYANINKENLRGVKALENMFQPYFEYGREKTPVWRDLLEISDSVPTNCQAEVLIEGIIDSKYINKIYFRSKEELEHYTQTISDGEIDKRCCVNNHYFSLKAYNNIWHYEMADVFDDEEDYSECEEKIDFEWLEELEEWD